MYLDKFIGSMGDLFEKYKEAAGYGKLNLLII